METNRLPDAEFFRGNRQRLLERSGCDLLVLAGNSYVQKSADQHFPFRQDSTFWYLTGLCEPSQVLVISALKTYLITPGDTEHRDMFDGRVDKTELTTVSGIDEILDEEAGWEKLRGDLESVKKIGTLLPPEQEYIEPLMMYLQPTRRVFTQKLKDTCPDIELVDLKPDVTALRAVKQQVELTAIRHAMSSTAEMYGLLDKRWLDAEYEYELLATAQHYLTMNGLEFAYDPIIASGKNAMTLHYNANRAPIYPEGALLVDVAARRHGYNADVTRTVIRKPTRRQRDIWTAVLELQQAAIKLLKPGCLLDEYEQAMVQYAGEQLVKLNIIDQPDKTEVRRYFPHLTSHFIGIDVHDVTDRETALQPGMVLTVEPGLYIPEENIGVRLEDIVVITESGHELLSGDIVKEIDRLA